MAKRSRKDFESDSDSDNERPSKIRARTGNKYGLPEDLPFERPILSPVGRSEHPGIAYTGKDWSSVLQDNLEVFEQLVQDLPEEEIERATRVSDEFLDDGQILLSIASVWAPLWEIHHRMAFGSEETYSSRTQEHAEILQQWVAGDREIPFLIPLRGHGYTFNLGNDYHEESFTDKDGPVGHWVLAVAQMDSYHEDQVNIYLLNSAKASSSANLSKIFEAAENVVRYNGWLGLLSTNKPRPFSGSFQRYPISVPLQTSHKTCGLHVILSAWALLLRIPMVPSDMLRGFVSMDAFYEDARRVVNCALAGKMDTRTIQALLNTYGFSVEQDINDEATAVPQVTLEDIPTDHWYQIKHRDGQLATFMKYLPSS
ncbi:hypothetical protein MMC11_007752 [Xylographa trunciseda]|nr:hypothetical protein [Xylographa trunciseda]